MSRQTNIRSLRLSDEMAELIDQQIGDTFTAKFTNLVTRCVWELPTKEAELQRIEKQIQEKKEELDDLYKSVRSIRSTIQAVNSKYNLLETVLTQELRSWDMNV